MDQRAGFLGYRKNAKPFLTTERARNRKKSSGAFEEIGRVTGGSPGYNKDPEKKESSAKKRLFTAEIPKCSLNARLSSDSKDRTSSISLSPSLSLSLSLSLTHSLSKETRFLYQSETISDIRKRMSSRINSMKSPFRANGKASKIPLSLSLSLCLSLSLSM